MTASASCRSDLKDNDPNEDSGTRAAEFEATDYYWYEGTKIPLKRMDGKFHVMFYTAEEDKLNKELANAGAKLLNISEEIREYYFYALDIIGSGVNKFTNYKTATVEGNYEKIADALSSALYWAPYYETENGSEIGTTNLIIVKLNPETSLTQLEKLAEENAVEMIGADKGLPEWYILACTGQSKSNALEMANLFYDSGLFEEAAPDFIAKVVFD
jgi:hypothetical protein